MLLFFLKEISVLIFVIKSALLYTITHALRVVIGYTYEVNRVNLEIPEGDPTFRFGEMIFIKTSIILLLLMKYGKISSACPDGMKLFLDAEGLLECFSCRNCPEGTTKVGNCTYEHDTICDECTDSEFYDDKSLHCKTCTVCDAGNYVKKNCSTFKDAECDMCPIGTFSLVQNSSSCTNCTKCSGKDVITQNFSKTADTVCAQNKHKTKNQELLDIVLLVVSIVVFLCSLTFCFIHALWHRKNERPGDTKECQRFLANEQKTEENANIILQDFKTNLKGFYRSILSGCIDDMFGEPYAEFNITCEISGNQQQGNGKDIKDFFYEHGKAFNRILVIGDASVGKTTLCRRLIYEFCHSDGDLLCFAKHIDWLFFIPLRHFRHMSSVMDMIQCCYLKNEKTLWSTILDTGEKVLVILDGYDEWKLQSGTVDENNASLDLSSLNELQNCFVLITTRPFSSSKLKSFETLVACDRKIKMENITSAAAAKFKQAVVQNLNIRENEEIIQPYINNNKITSHPLLLKQLVRLLCKDKIRKHPDEPLCNTFGKIVLNWLKDVDFVDETKQKCKQVLPDCLKTNMQSHKLLIHSLGKVSFEALVEHDSNIFELKTLYDAGISDLMRENCMRIGLLTQGIGSSIEHEECIGSKKWNLFSFPHRLYLDFFAAVYLFMNHASLTIFMKKYTTTQEIMYLRDVVLFFSGMKQSAMKSIFNVMMNTCDNESNLDNKLNIQSLLLECEEQQQTTNNALGLQSILICPDVFNENRTLNTDIFFKALRKSSALRIATLRLQEALDITIEGKLLEILNLKHLYLTTLTLNGNGCKPYIEYLHSGNVSKLTRLQISNIEVSHTEKQSLMKDLTNLNNVQELGLTDIRCNDHEQCPCPLELLSCPNLKTLTLNQVQLGWVRVNTNSLTDCIETDLPVFYSPASRKFKSSTELMLKHIECSADVDAFINLLPNLFRLSYLDVRFSDFGNKTILLSNNFSNLTLIFLKRVHMANEKLIRFINSIPREGHEVVCDFREITDLHSIKDISKRFEVISYEECVAYGKNIILNAKPKQKFFRKSSRNS